MVGKLLLVVVVLLVYYNYENICNLITLRKTCNEVDGRCYKIVNKYEDPIGASETLAHLNLFALKLMKHLRNKYIWERHGSPYERGIVEFLLHNYNPDNIIENDPVSDVNTSYVEDKGKVFAVCLREKQTGNNNLHDQSILQFVKLHEMAHLATREIGHGPTFWKNFKFLINEAVYIGLHSPSNYMDSPINYCSLNINHNPYFDPTI
jgi:hypothetical protein